MIIFETYSDKIKGSVALSITDFPSSDIYCFGISEPNL